MEALVVLKRTKLTRYETGEYFFFVFKTMPETKRIKLRKSQNQTQFLYMNIYVGLEKPELKIP